MHAAYLLQQSLCGQLRRQGIVVGISPPTVRPCLMDRPRAPSCVDDQIRFSGSVPVGAQTDVAVCSVLGVYCAWSLWYMHFHQRMLFVNTLSLLKHINSQCTHACRRNMYLRTHTPGA